MKHLASRVITWAGDRNIIKGSNPAYQFLKLVEERQEVQVATTELELVKEIGDYNVVSIIMLTQLGFSVDDWIDCDAKIISYSWIGIGGDIATDIAKGRNALNSIVTGMKSINAFIPEGYTVYDCVKLAFEKIEHRKGMMINGVYVKEEDL